MVVYLAQILDYLGDRLYPLESKFTNFVFHSLMLLAVLKIVRLPHSPHTIHPEANAVATIPAVLDLQT